MWAMISAGARESIFGVEEKTSFSQIMFIDVDDMSLSFFRGQRQLNNGAD